MQKHFFLHLFGVAAVTLLGACGCGTSTETKAPEATEEHAGHSHDNNAQASNDVTTEVQAVEAADAASMVAAAQEATQGEVAQAVEAVVAEDQKI